MRSNRAILFVGIVVAAVSTGACRSAASPGSEPGAPRVFQAAQAAAQIRIVGIEADLRSDAALGGGQQNGAGVVVVSLREGREVEVQLANGSGLPIDVETTDAVPLVGLEVFSARLDRWVHVWEPARSWCGNAEGITTIEPGRAMVFVVQSSATASPVRVRFSWGTLRSNDFRLAIDPGLIEAMSELAVRREKEGERHAPALRGQRR